MDRSKSENSLCETSMKVVTNMIRMSSFSLSQKTLGTCRSAAKVPEMEPLVVPPQFHGSRRLLEPQSRSNPIYVKLTENDGPNSHEIRKESIHVPQKKDADDSAFSEYITKTREQLGCGFKEQESRKSSSR